MRTINNTTLMSAGDMSQATLTSGVLDISSMFACCIQAQWTGAPVGVLKLQVSNDGILWEDLSGAFTNISGAGHTTYNVVDMGYPKIRALYTKTSGTGSLSMTANAKGV
jgi:hypothetical protein